MQVRRANPVDYSECVALDATVSTNLIWQMDEKADADRYIVEFRRSRLPRSVILRPSPVEGDALQRLAYSDLLLVATDERIIGYLKASRRRELGWLEEVVVAPQSRRAGVATALIREARNWVQAQDLRALLAEVPSRHQPAIALLQRCGFAFCGFDDHLYDGGDITMLFALKV